MNNCYRRVNPGSHAATIITTQKLTGVQGAVLHYDQDRILTPRESARLMGFRDDFAFTGGLDEQTKQIGR